MPEIEEIQNGESGESVREKINALIRHTSEKNIFVATISQSGVDAPSIDKTCENDFPSNHFLFVLGYVSPGRYSIIAFAPDSYTGPWEGPFKQDGFIPVNTNNFFNMEWVSETQVDIVCFFPSDNQLDKASIKFEQYV